MQQSGIAPEIWYKDSVGNGYKTPNYSVEKFANLLIQECIDKIQTQGDGKCYDDWDRGYEAGLRSAVRVIKENFGVE